MKCLKEKSPPEGFFLSPAFRPLFLLSHHEEWPHSEASRSYVSWLTATLDSCVASQEDQRVSGSREGWAEPLTRCSHRRCELTLTSRGSAAQPHKGNYPSTGVRGRWSDFSTFELNMVQGTWVIHSYFMTNPEPFTEPFTTYEYTWRFLVWTLLNFKGAVCTVFVLFFLLSFLFSAALN